MKISDKHVTRIELSADEVDAVLSAMAERLYMDRKVPGVVAAPIPPWEIPAAAPASVPSVPKWDFDTETARALDGGAVVTVTRTR